MTGIKDIIDDHEKLMEQDKGYRESFDRFGEDVESAERAVLNYLIHNKVGAGVAMASLTTVLGRVAIAEMKTHPEHKADLIISIKEATNELIKTIEEEATKIR